MTNKMFVILPALLLMGQINFENPDYLLLLRVAFASMQGILLLILV